MTISSVLQHTKQQDLSVRTWKKKRKIGNLMEIRNDKITNIKLVDSMLVTVHQQTSPEIISEFDVFPNISLTEGRDSL